MNTLDVKTDILTHPSITNITILNHKRDEHYSVVNCRAQWHDIPIYLKVGVVSSFNPISYRNVYELEYYHDILVHPVKCPFLMYPLTLSTSLLSELPWTRLRKYITQHFPHDEDTFCTLIASEYIRSVKVPKTKYRMLLEMSIQVLAAIEFMTHELGINQNDLHLNNILVERTETPWVWHDEQGNDVRFTIHCRVFDFDSATSCYRINEYATLPELRVFDSTGKRDWVKFVCWLYHYCAQPDYLTITFRDNRYGQELLRETMREQARSGNNCFFQLGRRSLLTNRNVRAGVNSIERIHNALSRAIRAMYSS